MKTLTSNDYNISLFLFADDEVVDIQSNRTVVGNPIKFIIQPCNSDNVTLHENVTEPDDYVGLKYYYDGTTWTENPDWVDPRLEE